MFCGITLGYMVEYEDKICNFRAFWRPSRDKLVSYQHYSTLMDSDDEMCYFVVFKTWLDNAISIMGYEFSFLAPEQGQTSQFSILL